MKINKSTCTNCQICVDVCVTDSINLSDYSINKDSCFNCSLCLAACPTKSITFNNESVISLDKKYTPSSENIEYLIKSRRTHRNFQDKKIPIDIINKICGLLKFAPTGTNSQNVFITVVPTKEKVKLLSQKMFKYFYTLSSIFLNYFFYPFLIVFIGSNKTSKLFKYKKGLLKYQEGKDILTFNAPCLFIFHAPKNGPTPEQDCSIWSTTGVYYAESLGLGTCFNGFLVYGLNANKKIKKSLGIPKDHKIYSTFLLGYPKYKFVNSVIREETKLNIV